MDFDALRLFVFLIMMTLVLPCILSLINWEHVRILIRRYLARQAKRAYLRLSIEKRCSCKKLHLYSISIAFGFAKNG